MLGVFLAVVVGRVFVHFLYLLWFSCLLCLCVDWLVALSLDSCSLVTGKSGKGVGGWKVTLGGGGLGWLTS